MFIVAIAFLGVNYLFRLSPEQMIPLWDSAIYLNAPWQLAHNGVFTWMGARPVANILSAFSIWLLDDSVVAVNYLSILIFAAGLFFYYRTAKLVFDNSLDGLLLCLILGMSYLVTFWVRNSVPYSLGITTVIISAYLIVSHKNLLYVTLILAIGFLSHPSVLFFILPYGVYVLVRAYAPPRGLPGASFYRLAAKHGLVFVAPIVIYEFAVRLNRFITSYPGDTSAQGVIPSEIASKIPFAETFHSLFEYAPPWLLKFLSNADANNINESYIRESWAYSSSSASTAWGQATWFDGLTFYPEVIAYLENPFIALLILLGIILLFVHWRTVQLGRLRDISIILAVALTIIVLNAVRGGITVARGIMVVYPIVLLVSYFIVRKALDRTASMHGVRFAGTIRIAGYALLVIFLGYSIHFNSSLYAATTPYWKIKNQIEARPEKVIYVCSRHKVLWRFLLNDLARKEIKLISNQAEARSFNALASPKVLVICQYADPAILSQIKRENALVSDSFSNEFSNLGITFAEGGNIHPGIKSNPDRTTIMVY